MNINKKLTVLLTTYFGDNPSYFRESLNSLVEQSLAKDSYGILIISDGKINPVIEAEINDKMRQYNNGDDFISILQLPENIGRSGARNSGLEAATTEFVAIMDSDDICYETRLQEQLDVLEHFKDIDCVSSWQSEFSGNKSQVDRVKKCPEYHEDIARALKFNCVIVNPSIMFRRRVYLTFGGYADLKHSSEDYDMFSRWLYKSVTFYCVQKPLIHVRATDQLFSRRGGFKVFKDDMSFRYSQYKRGQTNLLYFISVGLLYLVFRLIPPSLKKKIYTLVRQ